ncbi:PREDICTED: collagen alpha-1(IX) chain-like [Myotis brandtii]|uniref:collagen alpha-1(IX) chain-like n=1 Tax=Myotis brandtii TaxID=109478 RepID=UPI0003BBD53B|nr:PREDICTED: collagen alpha-1(IX) chain-like [Myotis brandtii]
MRSPARLSRGMGQKVAGIGGKQTVAREPAPQRPPGETPEPPEESTKRSNRREGSQNGKGTPDGAGRDRFSWTPRSGFTKGSSSVQPALDTEASSSFPRKAMSLSLPHSPASPRPERGTMGRGDKSYLRRVAPSPGPRGPPGTNSGDISPSALCPSTPGRESFPPSPSLWPWRGASAPLRGPGRHRGHSPAENWPRETETLNIGPVSGFAELPAAPLPGLAEEAGDFGTQEM